MIGALCRMPYATLASCQRRRRESAETSRKTRTEIPTNYKTQGVLRSRSLGDLRHGEQIGGKPCPATYGFHACLSPCLFHAAAVHFVLSFDAPYSAVFSCVHRSLFFFFFFFRLCRGVFFFFLPWPSKVFDRVCYTPCLSAGPGLSLRLAPPPPRPQVAIKVRRYNIYIFMFCTLG